MTFKRTMKVWTGVLADALVAGVPLGAWASHRWGCWRYANYRTGFARGISNGRRTCATDSASSGRAPARSRRAARGATGR